MLANRRAAGVLGRAVADLEGREWDADLEPEDRLRVSRAVGQVLSGTVEEWVGDLVVHTPSRRHVGVVLTRVPGEDGAEDLVLAQVEDRTTLYTASERLAGAEAVLGELGRAGGALSMVVDDHGVVLRFSDACERASGFAAEEVVGRPFWFGLVDPEDQAVPAALFGEVDAGGGLLSPPVGVGRWRTRDGMAREVLWMRSPLAWGPTRAHLLTGIDLTEQRLASGVFEAMARPSSRTAVVGTDRDGVVTYVNTAAERMTGRNAAELLGQTLDRLVDPAEVTHRAAVLGVLPGVEALLGALRGGATVDRQDWSLRGPGRQTTPAAVTLTASRESSGLVVGFVAVIVDVSEFRKAEQYLHDALGRERRVVEQLRGLDRLKSDFAATVSHELRTPVSSVLGFTELLLNGEAGDLGPAQRAMLERVDRNGRRLESLVEDLLALATYEGVPSPDQLRPEVALDGLVSDALTSTERELAGRDLDVRVLAACDGALVEADCTQLTRALGHVLSNAVKFTPDGGMVVVTTGVEDGQAVVTVKDDGYGIPSAELGAVFDRFFRSSVSQRRATQGAGLGLTIARAVVEGHGGEIAVHSVEGEGTEVTIRLPLAHGWAAAPFDSVSDRSA